MDTNPENADFIWQDRDIRFDSKGPLLECRKGETIIDSINRYRRHVIHHAYIIFLTNELTKDVIYQCRGYKRKQW